MAILRHLSSASLIIATLSFLLGGATCKSFFLSSVDRLYQWYGGEQTQISTDITLSNYHVGFSLHPSYGAVSVILENGTTVSYTVPGNLEYREVMAKLSLEESRHIAPPYNDPTDSITDLPRQLARTARKKLGLPSSPDVAALATTLTSLRSKLTQELGDPFPIHSATLSVPHLLALYQDDIQDLFEYHNIQYVEPDRLYRPLLWNTAAVYAGYGLGLCENWEDESQCRDEESLLPETVVLAIDYGTNALTTSLAVMKTATSVWEPDYRHQEDFTLGSDAKKMFKEEGEYWGKVKEGLQGLMVRNPGFKGPEIVVLSGEGTGEEGFRGVMEEAMMEVVGRVPEIFWEGAEVVAARGAVEFMRRKKR